MRASSSPATRAPSSIVWKAWPSHATELAMRHERNGHVERGEALANLGDGAAEHATLLLHGGCAEAMAGDQGFGGEQPFPRARRQEPGVAIAAEDHALQNIAHHGGHRSHPVGGEARQTLG